ncbi:hypothetical protein [Hydrocarboniclastica marina]|uniref:Cytochrome oxidase assembly protein n=1 Tax=Hydrocarboniclastica marina TaxID=2259620 RepID=A0A4P7XCN8_9ALTE|nr:hypothetical protein [Hydrocarboniclastica marina]MAM00497.1 hypothetical protein [Alteromonadaceae bacterium]QCF24516.1 hypothetical protein soil367_00270 [Hydrocarboniclastica marina]|tara:strand:- start:1303 stop:1950 length:648 start_codon:yes stop_codon:yes gene_type:complete
MTESNSPQVDPRAVRRGRVIALSLFAIALLPIVLASWMYFGGWGAVGGTANKGELLQPVGAVETLGLRTVDNTPLTDRFFPAREEPLWLILTIAEACDTACRKALHEVRQVHIALGKESERVERGLWVVQSTAAGAGESISDGQTLGQQYPELVLLEHESGQARPELPGAAELQTSYQIYVIDPNGNIVLRYDASNAGEDLLDDLKKLLRLSNIG